MIEFILSIKEPLAIAYVLSVMLVWLVAYRVSGDENPYDIPAYGIAMIVLWPVTAAVGFLMKVGFTAIGTWEKLMIRNKYGK